LVVEKRSPKPSPVPEKSIDATFIENSSVFLESIEDEQTNIFTYLQLPIK